MRYEDKINDELLKSMLYLQARHESAMASVGACGGHNHEHGCPGRFWSILGVWQCATAGLSITVNLRRFQFPTEF